MPYVYKLLLIVRYYLDIDGRKTNVCDAVGIFDTRWIKRLRSHVFALCGR